MRAFLSRDTDASSRDPRHMICDSSDQHLRWCYDFVSSQGSFYGKVLVHCNKGVSRSSTVVAAYLMRTRGLSKPAVSPRLPPTISRLSMRKRLDLTPGEGRPWRTWDPADPSWTLTRGSCRSWRRSRWSSTVSGRRRSRMARKRRWPTPSCTHTHERISSTATRGALGCWQRVATRSWTTPAVPNHEVLGEFYLLRRHAGRCRCPVRVDRVRTRSHHDFSGGEIWCLFKWPHSAATGWFRRYTFI